ncbi:hypothetical protein [Isoptericola luteus]|uniref:hypothetical protein n=1 Tax=Isoptericola luteus TaxID=2879484 RepID=UPI0027E00B76|nr:hypothetical protein [Isoptericola sp. NEAU-Y5]
MPDGDRSVERHDRIVRLEPDELVVPLEDLRPVRLGGGRGVVVQRGDRRLGLVGTEPVARESVLQQTDALGDGRGVPQGAVLLRQGHQRA